MNNTIDIYVQTPVHNQNIKLHIIRRTGKPGRPKQTVWETDYPVEVKPAAAKRVASKKVYRQPAAKRIAFTTRPSWMSPQKWMWHKNNVNGRYHQRVNV
jgi:hypothetical protein